MTSGHDEYEPTGDQRLIEAVCEHVEMHLGPIEVVFHEKRSEHVHIDVYRVGPSEALPYYKLVTSGVSERPMNGPIEYVELLVLLPADRKLDFADFSDERNYWPVRWLKKVGILPHDQDTWLGPGHTIPNGDPPIPLAPNTKLCCIQLEPPMSVPRSFWSVEVDRHRVVSFLTLVPIYPEELEFKIRYGSDALLERFDSYGVTDVVNLERPNVCVNESPRPRLPRPGPARHSTGPNGPT